MANRLNKVLVTTIHDHHGIYCFAVHRKLEDARRHFVENYILNQEDFSEAFLDDCLEDFRKELDNENWEACINIYINNRVKWMIPYMRMEWKKLDAEI